MDKSRDIKGYCNQGKKFLAPYEPRVEIVTDPITGAKIETTTVQLRGLIDNYSNVFKCLFARFYETMLIRIFKYIGLKTLSDMRYKLSKTDNELPELNPLDKSINDELVFQIEKGLQSIVSSSSDCKKICKAVAQISYVDEDVLVEFISEMAKIDLEYVYNAIDEWERAELQDRLVEIYSEPSEMEYLLEHETFAEYDLMGILNKFKRLENFPVLIG